MKLLTFDIEEYYHLLDASVPDHFKSGHTSMPVCDLILKVLRERGVRAIFFCVGETARDNPDVIKKIIADGHTIGSHSMRHKLHSELSDDEFREDLRESLDILSELSGVRVDHYRAPGFSITREYLYRFEILESCGVAHDFSIFLNGGSHGGIKESDLSSKLLPQGYFEIGGIKSYPFTKSRIFGVEVPLLGGGYFRLFPSILSLAAAQRSNSFVTYFHPRDFDPMQPRLEGLSRVRRFKSYVGLHNSFSKLERLVRSVDWTDPSTIADTNNLT